MGIQGAPWAQNIALAVALGYLVAVVFFGSYKKRFSLFSFRLEWAVLRKMFYLSTPGGVRHFIGLGAYLVFFRIVEQMGTVDLAVANIGRAVFNFQFMPVLGIGFAGSSLVSRNLGQKRPLQAEANTWHAYQLATLVSVAVYVIVAVFAPEIASVFTEDPHVAHLAVGCFRIGGLFLVLMPAGMIFAATLEGAGNIWLVLGFEAVCCAIYLGCAWLFGITWGEGVTGAYAAETVYWLVFGTVCAAFFLRRAWHHTKV
ncbi:MAG: MATE family efflux transporter [Planctomycetota bacterium]|nr:MATE family efflux transporter [Planctomycetota bacterium]